MDTSLASAAPFFREPGTGSTLNVIGVTHIYKALGTETGGLFSVWEAVFPAGAGAPPHTHTREDEAFYVLSGELVVEVEGEPAPRRLSPGGFFFGARGWRHAVRNERSTPARVLIWSVPSCGLDQMFAEFDAATASGTMTMGNLVAIAAKYGVTIEAPAEGRGIR
jgi:quercetin dioxygenase-like cupin family protein